LSPAKILDIEINEEDRTAVVQVSEDQLSLAIGKGGQNVRLAARLTGFKIDIQSAGGENKDEENTENKKIEVEAIPKKEKTEAVEETSTEEVVEKTEEEK
ncbi:transcription termination/antitermination protein NusA, partial [Patescibacteria group bacterium]|nr:transcription termination/antitermination protein NusA [Patescibacteria group bacterium]